MAPRALTSKSSECSCVYTLASLQCAHCAERTDRSVCCEDASLSFSLSNSGDTQIEMDRCVLIKHEFLLLSHMI